MAGNYLRSKKSQKIKCGFGDGGNISFSEKEEINNKNKRFIYKFI
jgi:hypothetical protein